MTSGVPSVLEALDIGFIAPEHPPGQTAGRTSPTIVQGVHIEEEMERTVERFRSGDLRLLTPGEVDAGHVGLLVLTEIELEQWLLGFEPTERWEPDEWFGVGQIRDQQVVVYPDDRLLEVSMHVFSFQRGDRGILARRAVLPGLAMPSVPTLLPEECRHVVSLDFTRERCGAGSCANGRCVPQMSSRDGRTSAVACWCQ